MQSGKRSSSQNLETSRDTSSTSQRAMQVLTEKLTALRSFLWLIRWRRTTDKSPKPEPVTPSFPKAILSKLFSSRSSTEPKTSRHAFSSRLTSAIANVSCPTCDRLSEEALNLVLTKLSEEECQDLMKLFLSTDYKVYRRVLLRSRADVMRKMPLEDDPMEFYRLQGRHDQIRIEEAMPAEIQGLLSEFVQQDERNRELQEAKEKRDAEVR